MENGELRLGVDLGGTGTGGGIVVDERLVAGPSGIAGEWATTRCRGRVPMSCRDRHVFSDRVDTGLVRALHGDSSGVRGAVWLWAPG
jgi:predicted NBD/HSP70 family sugar kinase